MFTFREYEADKYRRQEMMARAEQHRLQKSVLAGEVREVGYFRRSLGRIGERLVALGQRLEAQSIAGNRTSVAKS